MYVDYNRIAYIRDQVRNSCLLQTMDYLRTFEPSVTARFNRTQAAVRSEKIADDIENSYL